MRDVSRILTEADLLKLREILKQTTLSGAISPDPQVFAEYPRMLFAPGWVECYRICKEHPDPLIRKDAREKMRVVQVIVHDLETEEDYLQDGWKNDPNDLVIALNLEDGVTHPDPRIPTGREGRRARIDTQRSRERELQDIRRRYAELTGRKLLEEETVELTAEPPVVEDPPRPPLPDVPLESALRRPPLPSATKRDRAKQAAQQSMARA